MEKSEYYCDFHDRYCFYGDIVVLSINALEVLRHENSAPELGKDKHLVMETLLTNLEVFSRILRRLEAVSRKKE